MFITAIVSGETGDWQDDTGLYPLNMDRSRVAAHIVGHIVGISFMTCMGYEMKFAKGSFTGSCPKVE